MEATEKDFDERLKEYREWLLSLKILDPACGSGAFLNAALKQLQKEHALVERYWSKIHPGELYFENIDNEILENNLFGVDINEESVEIAKLSLWLSTAKKNRKLSTLSGNIQCGNSLVSDAAVAGEKAFDWQREFPNVFKPKINRIWHITTATHDSRTSQRMIDYKVRLLRFHGTKPYADPKWIDEIEEQIITETFAKIVKEDHLKIPAYNICGDHMHFLLVCEQDEVSKIVGKIKSMTARAVNIAMGRTVPRDMQQGEAYRQGGMPPCDHVQRGETQYPLWAQKFGCVQIDSNEYYLNAIEYIKNNRLKHGLPPLKNIDVVPICPPEEAFRQVYSGGFDVVISNPPYVQLQSLGNMSDNYAKCGYQSYNKSADLYCLFTERGYNLLKKGGLQSFIMPNKWMLVDYGKELRRFLSKTAMQQIINFGDVQFFQDATIYVCIFVTRKSAVKGNVLAASFNKKTYHGDFPGEVPAALQEFEPATFAEEPWIIRDATHSKILDKMSQNGIKLKDLPIEIFRGILTGYNDAFFIDGQTRNRLIADDPNSAALIKPLLRGRDITAWNTEKKDQYLVCTFPALNLDIENYPAIKNHLLSFGKERLEQSGAKGARKKTSNAWYETQDQISYYEYFSKPKIVYPNMTSAFPFSYDESGSVCNDKAFIITSKDENFPLKELLAILNSKLTKLWIWYNCPELQGGTREIRKAYFENFPVPAIFSETRTDKGACPLVYGDSDNSDDSDDNSDNGNENSRNIPIPAIPPEEQKPLAALADQMLTLHADLQKKAALFLSRVKDNLGLRKASPTLESFHTLPFGNFVKELGRQKIRLSLKEQDEWQEYFEEYKADISALTAEISRTDDEINAAVYKLYGLSADRLPPSRENDILDLF